jgi:hypothetical protein
VLIDEGGQAGKYRLVAVALQLYALIKQRRHLKAALLAYREEDESVLVYESKQAGKHRLLAVVL